MSLLIMTQIILDNAATLEPRIRLTNYSFYVIICMATRWGASPAEENLTNINTNKNIFKIVMDVKNDSNLGI